MSKHVGIVACSSEGAALCYRTICLEAGAQLGEHYHPEVFEELVHARLYPESRLRVVEIIQRFAGHEQCDAVVLGCTELPLLIAPADSPLPTLDSTRLLARAALRDALC